MLTKLKNRINRAILVIRHARAMWRALTNPKNERKGDWRGMDAPELLKLAQREQEELHVSCWELECGKGTAQRVEEEAADLSVFAAMIADNARRKEESRD